MLEIPAHRKQQTRLHLVDPAGSSLPAGAPVRLEQTHHSFLFGTNMFTWERCATVAENRAYAQQLKDLFNYVSVPFYWGDDSGSYPWDRAYEPQAGVLNEAWLRKMASWCADHQITVKGHPLVFARVPQWAEALTLALLETKLWRRVTREVSEFKSLIQIWDVVNEPAQMVEKADWLGGLRTGELYRKRGAVQVIATAFDLAHAANPDAVLVLNDWDTSDRFLELCARCLDAGAKIDAIGLQYHELEHYHGPDAAWETCERFATLGLPLHVTELMIPSGDEATRAAFQWQTDYSAWASTPEGEARQAREVAELYATLFAHPAVAAITWWDLSDQGSYQATPTGLLRRDMAPKPAYAVLRDLIKGTWWTDRRQSVLGGGILDVEGIKGDYNIRVDSEVPLAGEFRLDAGTLPDTVVPLKPVDR